MERVTVLGSSNAIAKSDQENSYLLVESDARKIMVDCGNHPVAGLARAGVKWEQVTDLILTHFHPDHVGSLPLLIMDMWLERRSAPLVIYGLDFTLERVKKMLDLFSWEKWKNMFSVTFREIEDNGEEGFIDDDEIQVSALPVLHLIPNIGLRFEFKNGKIYTYSCDTEPCENLNKLAEYADVLLQESAGESKGHTSPEQAGNIATECNVKRLVLIHYEAKSGKEFLITEAKKSFAGDVDLAYDGLVL
jgi:ribonuclease Z